MLIRNLGCLGVTVFLPRIQSERSCSEEDTRFLSWIALKETYQDKPWAFLQANSHIADDLRAAMDKGFKVYKEGQEWTIHLVCTGVKGDWPFLIETASLERHFRRAPKRGASGMAPGGVCHYCLAGLPGLSFADCSFQPPFERHDVARSAAAMTPWSEITPFTEKLPMFRDFPPLLYKADLWHNWHLGAGRYFIASCVVVLSELYPGRGVDVRLAGITQSWLRWCRAQQAKPLLRKFCRDNSGFQSELDWPEGCWQKASTTTLLMEPWLMFIGLG